MSWEARLEQLAFDTKLSEHWVEGQHIVLMQAMYIYEEFAEPVMRQTKALNRIRQADFESAIELGYSMEGTASVAPLTLDDIRDEERSRDEDIEDGYILGTWRRPSFYGETRQWWELD